MCFIASVALTFTAYMVIFLATEPTGMLFAIALPVTFVVAWLFLRAVLTFIANKECREKMSVGQQLYSIFGVWSFSTILDRKGKAVQSVDVHDEELLREIYQLKIVDFGYRILLI